MNSAWINCSANLQSSGCTFSDIVIEVLQHQRWKRFNDHTLEQRRYHQLIDSWSYICNNIYPGCLRIHVLDIVSIYARDVKFFSPHNFVIFALALLS